MASPVNPRVSVVIPTYNQAHYLRETLVSVRAQTVPEWEAIVVNNFSEDDTLETVAGFNDERISVVNFRNEGIIAASRNQGVGRARAEWVAFLDSDDWWAPEKLERCLAAVTDDTAVLGHDMVMIKDGRQVSTHRSGPAARASFRRLLFEGTCVTPSASLVRKSWLDTVGGFSEDAEYRTAEDYELWLKLAHAGARFDFIPEPLTCYRLHDASSSRRADVHLNASLKIVDHHFRLLGDRRAGDALRLRRRLAALHYGAARTLQKAGVGSRARTAALRSALTYPLQLRAYAVFLLSFAARP